MSRIHQTGFIPAPHQRPISRRISLVRVRERANLSGMSRTRLVALPHCGQPVVLAARIVSTYCWEYAYPQINGGTPTLN